MQNQNDNFEKFRPLKIKIMETIHTFAEEFIAKINEQSDAELDGFMGLGALTAWEMLGYKAWSGRE